MVTKPSARANSSVRQEPDESQIDQKQPTASGESIRWETSPISSPVDWQALLNNKPTGSSAALHPIEVERKPEQLLTDNSPNIRTQTLSLPTDTSAEQDDFRPASLEITDRNQASRILGQDFTPKSAVFLDHNGYVNNVSYPNGRSRHIGRGTDNQPTAIITTGKDGTTTLTKKGNDWFITAPGIELPFNGKVKVENSGDVCFRMNNEAFGRREHPNGTVAIDRLMADGSELTFGANNQVERVVRADGYVIQQLDGNTIAETLPGQKTIVWKKEGDTWLSDNPKESPRKNFHIDNRGAVAFETNDGIKHTVTRKGKELLEGPGKAKIELDDYDRMHTFIDAKNSSKLQYTYFDNESRTIKSVVYTDLDTGAVKTYTRDSKTSIAWEITDGQGKKLQPWFGEVGTTTDNQHLVREAKANQWGRKTKPAESDPWTTYTDGKASSLVLTAKDIHDLPILVSTNEAAAETDAAKPLSFQIVMAGERTTSNVFDPVQIERSLKRDNGGYISDIEYGSGKSRHLNRDANNQVIGIITKTPEGTTELVKKDNRWFLRDNGLDVPFPGKVECEANGDVCFQTDDKGSWRRERPGGSIVIEKTNETGARLCYDSQNQVQHVTRKDGSIIERLNANTIAETAPGQKPVIWTKQGDVWIANPNTKKSRRNLEITQNGDTSYLSSTGLQCTIAGDGSETRKNDDFTLKYDANDRLTDVIVGNEKRHYEYFNDTTYDIKSFTFSDTTAGTQKTMTRSDATSWRWQVADSKNPKVTSWYGDVRVGADGVHSYLAVKLDRQGRVIQPEAGAKWNSYHPDGSETMDKISADGSRTAYDSEGHIVGHKRPDGYSIVQQDENHIQVYDPKLDKTVTWARYSDGRWISDSANLKDARRNLTFDDHGNLIFDTASGDKTILRPNWSSQVIKRDGTKLELDKDKQILTATKGDFIRTFTHANGEIQTVKDFNVATKETRLIFSRRPGKEEDRTHIHVSQNGDLSYANKNGIAVIERSNRVRLELDADGDIIRSFNGKCSRVFQYSGEGKNKILQRVVDTRMTEKGQREETWTRVKTLHGWSSEFRSQTPEGKPRPSRLNIEICADGEYEYRRSTDKPGDKVHIARLRGDGFEDGVPESVEDAHYDLVESLERCMDRDKPRLERMKGMMKQFEQRMKDQLELMVAGGIPKHLAEKEIELSMAETYFHTNRLLTAHASRPMYDHRTRVDLAENLICLAADPRRAVVQGSTGTCWWESSWNVGLFQRNANHAARLVADVALTRQYTSTAGPMEDRYGRSKAGRPKTIAIPPEYVAISRNKENSGYNWRVENVGERSTRSPVGMIIDQVGPPILGWRGFGQSNAGGHGEARNILYMLTGKDEIRHGNSSLGNYELLQLLKTGGWTSSGGGHMWAYTMRKVNGEWLVYKDDQYAGNDYVIKRIANIRQFVSSETRAKVLANWKQNKPRKA